ncbi:hypothetical protein Y1Q_0001800 [Alligator mississippiensis]|uniref:Uncharacterized protein n=1 Tax=Alligator mississippiensis TaxID=8496 RepID=A0A151MKV0_ALLMI|nr:hypothetical protein Y1Q_0001800 [Alligator mississippiensis]
MCWLLQQRTQDKTWLLGWLVMMAKEPLAGSWAWHVEDIMCEWERDSADQEFWHRLLEKRHLWAQEQQTVMVARAVEAMREDCPVLDTILALAVAFVPSTAQPLAVAPPVPWQPPTAQQHAS